MNNIQSFYKNKKVLVYITNYGKDSIAHDALVDILDILMIVNTIINESAITDYQTWASDLNQDQIIDILDILMIVDLIVN